MKQTARSSVAGSALLWLCVVTATGDLLAVEPEDVPFAPDAPGSPQRTVLNLPPQPVIPPEMRLAALPERAPDPEDNPTTPAKRSLGRLLFFDPILSATSEVSCATCHHPQFGWTDGRAAPIGVGGTGLGPNRVLRDTVSFQPLARNTPTLLNVAFNGLLAGVPFDPARAPMFWDSRVRGLEAQALVPLQSREEMRGDLCAETVALDGAVTRLKAVPEYRRLFGEAFEQPDHLAVTAEHIAQAIAVFERSLLTPNTPFDRFMRGDKTAMNAEQQHGMRIFQEAGCIQCHGGPMFSDFQLHFLGVSDDAVNGRREFRTPTLRNLNHTAPYMHDGSQRTLEDTLQFYDALADAVSEAPEGEPGGPASLDPLLRHLNLKPADFPALEAFLHTLSDDSYDQTAPALVPSRLPLIK